MKKPNCALQIKNLYKDFSGNVAVNEISFEIQKGEIFGLLGPNGAGKSTTINMISGVNNIGSGTVEVFGFDNQTEYLTTRKLTGVMHQEIIMDNFFPVGKWLQMHPGFFGKKDDPKWRNLIVDRLSLRPHLGKKLLSLSGGMRRRVMIAKALVHKPDLLILDEPTAGVDVELRVALWRFIREINHKHKTTILLTTHYLEEAEKMCDRIAIMNQGKIVALEKTKKLIQQLGEKRLTVTLKKPIKELSKKLTHYPVQLQKEGKELVFTLTGSENTAEILKNVFSEGMDVENIHEDKTNLEDVFLKLTGTKEEVKL